MGSDGLRGRRGSLHGAGEDGHLQEAGAVRSTASSGEGTGGDGWEKALADDHMEDLPEDVFACAWVWVGSCRRTRVDGMNSPLRQLSLAHWAALNPKREASTAVVDGFMTAARGRPLERPELLGTSS